MASQSRKDKWPVVSCFSPCSNWKQCLSASHLPGNCLQHIRKLCNCPCNDQFFLCPGQRHIKNSQFFPKAFPFELSPYDLFVYCWQNQTFFRKDDVHSEAHIRMDQKTTVDILKIELFSHSCCKHDWKFQSFTFVYCHDLHCTVSGISQIYFSKIHFIFLQFFYITNEVKQSTIACFFVFHCFFHKHMKVCTSLCTTRNCSYIIPISCFSENILDQLMNRCVHRKVTHFFQQLYKMTDLLS